MAERRSEKVTSFSQFDMGKGTEAARRGKSKPSTSSRPSRAPSRSASGPRPKTEDQVRRDMTAHRRGVLKGGAGGFGSMKNQGGGGEGR